ncbi:MAG TPA: methylated-DNA--[protein]-cysteine S-methyltransferase [Pseudolabrys sp.]|nr:methylated-DNA--[protein]-cysteine S-methyltransferase [Pseudolabrys sp.]
MTLNLANSGTTMSLANHAVSDRFPELAPLPTAAADYDVVRRAIAHIRGNWRSQPEIEKIAEAAGVTATDLHHLFRRWCGLTPKAFLQALTLNSARELLRSSASVLDTSYEVGLSGPGRLHDLFVTHEAMSPGEWKAGGEGLTISYGFHPSPFGTALVMATPRGLAGLALADGGKERTALKDMRARWPKAKYVEDFAATAPLARRIFDTALWRPDRPLRVVLIGTDFEVRVWEKLLDIPMGNLDTYSGIARKIGEPKAARAVGAAVGKNPICFVVPCHRVVGKNGDITGYHWGITRKRAMLGWEAGRITA